MGDGYTKLFADIVDSSIWHEDSEVRVVWVTLLALCNADGFVRGSVGWLAGKARVPEVKVRQALDTFQRPDPQSRTPDHEGRRIEQLPDGWLVLNYLAFRDRLSSSPKAVSTRERVRRHRERYRELRNANSVTPHHSASASVSEGSSEGTSEGTGEGDARGRGDTPVFALKAELNRIYRRNDREQWSYIEESTLAEVARSRPDCMAEVRLLESSRKQRGKFFPQTVLKLLENWTGALDVARNPETRDPQERTLIDKMIDAL